MQRTFTISVRKALSLPRHDREGKDALPWSKKIIGRLVRSMRRRGWRKDHPMKIKVRRDGSMFIDEGNHRLAAARRLRRRRVPVLFIDSSGYPIR